MAKLFSNDLSLQLQRLDIVPGAGDSYLKEQLAEYDPDPVMLELISSKFPMFTQKYHATAEIVRIWQPEDFYFENSYILNDQNFDAAGTVRKFISIGLFDGGNWLVCLEFKDTNAEDPSVYIFDHYDPGQKPTPCMKLSKFFSLLEANESSGSGLQPGQKPKARPKMI